MGANAGTISTGRSEIPNAAEHGVEGHYTERQLSWEGGAIFSKRRNTDRRSDGRFVHDRLGIGFGFQPGNGDCEWLADGQTVLSRRPNPSIDFRDLVVLPAGCEFQGTARGRGECLWLHIDRPLVEDKGVGRSIASMPIVDSNWSRDRLLWALMSELREECREDFPRGTLFVETATLAFLTQLEFYLHRRQLRLPAGGTLRRDRIALIRGYVEDNIGRRISLGELSALVNLTPVHFCRAFKEATGHSPHQYVIGRQIERAKSLLSGSRMSLAEIAITAGFSHQSHLCYHFRRIVGATPGQYRRETGGIAIDDE